MKPTWKDFVKSAQSVTGYVGPSVYPTTKGPDRNIGGIDFSPVYDFYSDIAPEIRKRQLGVDKLPKNEEKAFRDLGGVPVRLVDNIEEDPGWVGVHSYPNESIRIKRRDPDLSSDGNLEQRTLVHELRHALERRIPSRKSDMDNLDKIWGFRGVDISPNRPGYSDRWGEEEMATTNKEHQFNEYQALRYKLGRKPTAKEYFDYVESLDGPAALYNRKIVVNGYQNIADKAIGTKYNAEKGLEKRLEDVRRKMNAASMPSKFIYTNGNTVPKWFSMMPQYIKDDMTDGKGHFYGSGLFYPRNVIEMGEKAIFDNAPFEDRLEDYKKGLMEISRATPAPYRRGWMDFTPDNYIS